MTDQGTAGWQPDPTGRYAQRYHDGNNWTEHVFSAAGQQSVDTQPVVVAPPPPPMAQLPAAQSPAQQGWQQPSNGPTWQTQGQPQGSSWGAQPQPQPQSQSQSQSPVPSSSATVATWGQGPQQSPGGDAWRTAVQPTTSTATGPWIVSILVAALGFVGVGLSLFLLDWVEGGTFLDIRKGVGGYDPPEFLDNFVKWSCQFASFALFGITVIVTALVVLMGNGALRRVGAIVAALGAVLLVFTSLRRFHDQEIGMWVGAAGYVVVLVGLFLDAQRARD